MIELVDNWKNVKLRAESELLRKENYVYRVEGVEYAIELFETIEGKFYAIGLPTDPTKLIIYGSSVVDGAKIALQQTIQKIDRDHFMMEIKHIGEDNRPDEDIAD